MPDLKRNYDDWHESNATSSEHEHLQPWHENAVSLLPDLNNLSVLELGCGRGDFALWLSIAFPEADITAVDFSETAIRVAQGRIPSTIRRSPKFRVEDAQYLSFGSAAFDFVVSCECLEHIPTPEKMAAEIARVLKPGGQFVITTENYSNGLLLGWLHCWLTDRRFDSGSGVQPHENFFLFWRVRSMLERAGLGVRNMSATHFQWLLLPGIAPDKLRTNTFKSAKLNKLFRPFGRHFTFAGVRM